MMESGTVTRRLAAIVIADVVGYTRLMERDDTGTYARVRLIRDEVVDPAILSHGGRIVKTAGDGVVAEFTSALAALRASIQIQRQMQTRNGSATMDERIDYRIGVNLGDIMVEGNDIAGDGVNVASRLEALAEPGGICVSVGVREQVHGQLDVEFVDGGEQRVKNLARPIRVFRVLLDGAASTSNTRSAARRFGRLRSSWLGPVIALTLSLTALAVWLGPQFLDGSGSRQTLPTMSVAIEPFAGPPGPEGRNEAEQVSHSLASAIGQDRWVQVIALNDAAEAKSRLTHVRYIVEGEVTPTILTARLMDRESSTQLWSERFERRESAPGMMNAEQRLALHLDRAVHLAARERVARRDYRPSTPMDFTLLAIAAGNSVGMEAVRQGQKYVEQALRLDSRFVPALVAKAFFLQAEFEYDPSRKTTVAVQMDQLTSLATTLDQRDDWAWRTRSYALAWLGRWEEALAAIDRAQRLVPWQSAYITDHAILLWLAGRAEEAESIQVRAIAMDPPGGAFEFRHLCIVRLLLGRYDQAAQACEKAGGLDNWYEDQLWLIGAYAQKGDLTKAARAVSVLKQQQPGLTIENSLIRAMSDNPTYVRQLEAHVYPGLRKAGIPER